MGVLCEQASGLEILHGGEGRDVELGARTSKHILLFALDPLTLSLYLSLYFVPCNYSYCAFIFLAWLCVHHLLITLECNLH